MAGVYANTSNIADGTTIDAADVKAPIDALDTQVAGMAAATYIVNSASGFLTGAVLLSTALASPPAIGGTAPATGKFTTLTALPAVSEGIYIGTVVPALTKGASILYSTANDRLEIQSIFQGTGAKTLYLNPAGGAVVLGQTDVQTVLSVDGAITVAAGSFAITKGSIAAITIVAPTAGAPNAGGQDGTLVRIYSETAFAHVVTCASVGYNGKNASGTLTFAAARGNGVTLEARNGQWWVKSNIGVTVA